MRFGEQNPATLPATVAGFWVSSGIRFESGNVAGNHCQILPKLPWTGHFPNKNGEARRSAGRFGEQNPATLPATVAGFPVSRRFRYVSGNVAGNRCRIRPDSPALGFFPGEFARETQR
jgi:hypothetical protein